MKAPFRSLALVIGMLGISVALRAAPIYFIFSGIDGGSLGGIGFNDVPFYFEFESDTIDLSYFDAITPELPVLSGTIMVAGLGTADFVGQSLYVFNNQSNYQGLPVVGFGFQSDYLDITATGAGLENYGLDTSILPVSGSPYYEDFYVLSTSRGLFYLNAGGVSDPTFQAITLAPEPSIVAIIFPGLLSLIGIQKRK